MNDLEGANCPLCEATNTERILALKCATIDGSALYKNINVHACSDCGHIYNQLRDQDKQGLIRYYQEEYAPTNLTVSPRRKDQQPPRQQFSGWWYEQLYGRMKPFVEQNYRVLDVGCGGAGFLNYLHQLGFDSLFGIDIAPLYIKHAGGVSPAELRPGNAEQLPFSDDYFDCLVMDQVLEHVPGPRQVFCEARRVLRPGGTLCVALPNASSYSQHYFFHYFWFVLREHIQHFDLVHLKWLAENEGFELVYHESSEVPLVNQKMSLHNLTAIFKLTKDIRSCSVPEGCLDLRETTQEYIATERNRFRQKAEQIQPIIQSKRPIYFWGIGREFLFLFKQLELVEYGVVGLIDSNHYKQKNATVNGLTIKAPEVLAEASPESVLLITAVAHKQAISDQAREMGFTGQVVSF